MVRATPGELLLHDIVLGNHSGQHVNTYCVWCSYVCSCEHVKVNVQVQCVSVVCVVRYVCMYSASRECSVCVVTVTGQECVYSNSCLGRPPLGQLYWPFYREVAALQR